MNGHHGIRAFRYRGLIRLRRRTKIKVWMHRLYLRVRYGQHLLDLMDECAASAERSMLLGEEHMHDHD